MSGEDAIIKFRRYHRTGKYVPERILTNRELEQMVETNDEWIVSRTGIRERRIAAAEQATSDLAFEASKIALQAAGITAEDLDLIIVATITPDMYFPSTACLLQDKLGAKKAAAFDLSAACSGFIYGMATASNMIATGMYKHVLVVGAECLSRITDYTDRNTSFCSVMELEQSFLVKFQKAEASVRSSLALTDQGASCLKLAAEVHVFLRPLRALRINSISFIWLAVKYLNSPFVLWVMQLKKRSAKPDLIKVISICSFRIRRTFVLFNRR